jgi:hypothetical protein
LLIDQHGETLFEVELAGIEVSSCRRKASAMPYSFMLWSLSRVG